ncbi:hypothetical protein Kpho02_17240 [Kitasatospora phosalacinea]|uniref:Uncharacterized protein n=1 Tax=Kitasatospora phosalacinea TaxID=2065 RepID=A0A9W6V1Y0_9ACTN|nr:DUF6584 family protein [Kitasatospora phosalacinea]GLW69425.1 hypothetical protein Kpho02_17240 [Kitasatospora phosalacinea]
MSVESTLARAAAELRAGRHPQARRRLHGLLSGRPTDLTVRRHLADAYRPTGQWDESGRWNYLDEALSPDELAAFERRFPDSARRLRVLRWPDPAHHPPSTPLARRRLAALYREATGTAPDWPEHPEDAATPAATRPRGPRPVRPACAPAVRAPELPPHRAALRLTLALFGALLLLTAALRVLV